MFLTHLYTDPKTRTVRRLLLIPRRIAGRWRWLRMVTVDQEVRIGTAWDGCTTTRLDIFCWEAVSWSL